jgi:hypothetical protein
MAQAASEGTEVRAFARLAWGPIIAGVLLALAANVVLGLVGGALGLAAEPGAGRGLGVLAAFWGLLSPFVATLLGAWLACRLAGRADEAGTNLHGVMVWCIGLVAGALFLAGTGASGAMQRLTGDRGADVIGPRTAAPDAITPDAAARRAAATAGGGAMAALCGLLGAFAGAAVARSRRAGRGLGLGFGWRIAIQRTERRPGGGVLETSVHHAEAYRTPAADVHEVPRTEGRGEPAGPVQH